jgi:hypothetical protein
MPTNPQDATDEHREGVGKDDAKPEDQPVKPNIGISTSISAPSVGSELSFFPCMLRFCCRASICYDNAKPARKDGLFCLAGG